eukprot:3680899-Rhodomonas_salina.3
MEIGVGDTSQPGPSNGYLHRHLRSRPQVPRADPPQLLRQRSASRRNTVKLVWLDVNTPSPSRSTATSNDPDQVTGTVKFSAMPHMRLSKEAFGKTLWSQNSFVVLPFPSLKVQKGLTARP